MTPAYRKEIAYRIRWIRNSRRLALVKSPTWVPVREILADMKAARFDDYQPAGAPADHTDENSRRALLDYERCREWSRT